MQSALSISPVGPQATTIIGSGIEHTDALEQRRQAKGEFCAFRQGPENCSLL